jgi:predicted Zn-dependent protease with MMP-like domain
MSDPEELWLDSGHFNRLVERALDDLPAEFADALENIAVVVQDEPEPELLAEYGFDPNDELLGLYEGVPLPERDGFYQSLPDRISIYRGPLLRLCRTRLELIDEVRDTVVHEIGHYFGLDDGEMPY